jgi:hypothetical protein
MNAASNWATVQSRPGDRDRHLQGRWLLVARIAWVALTLLILTLNAVMIPRYYAVLQTPCQPGPSCFGLQLTVYDQRFLHQAGISLGFVAGYQIMLDAVTVLINCALGALIFWRRSEDRMALFCAYMLVLFGGAGLTSILQDTLGVIPPTWSALVGALDVVGQTSFLTFFLLFPSGRFVPRLTRLCALLVLAYWIVTVFFSQTYFSTGASPNSLVFFALLLCIVGAQVYRYCRVSTTNERQQTKLVVFGFVIGIAGFVLLIIVGNVLLHPALQQSSVLRTFVEGTGTYGFLLLVPISIAVAILRSRLYDIDVIINRALVYGSLTVILGAVYFGTVVGTQTIIQALTGQRNPPPAVIVASTLLIAALFTPLRHRLQAGIDRRFYRRRYDTAKTLASFGATLRTETDLERLREHVQAVVERTMQPAQVSLWLRSPQPERTSETATIHRGQNALMGAQQ